MNNLLDVIFAFIIVGILILAVLQVDMNVKANAINIQKDLIAQENTGVLSEIIEYDLRKIGHGLRHPFRAIKAADTSRVVFSYDRNPTTVLDSIRVEYRVIPAQSTPNPDDILIQRIVNGNQTNNISLGATRLRFSYYNDKGLQFNTPVVSDSLQRIRTIEMILSVESKESFQGEYSQVDYQTRITPKNLLIRWGQ